MKKFFAVLVTSMFVVSIDACQLVIDESRRIGYGHAVISLVDSISTSNTLLNWCATKLVLVSETLVMPSVSIEDRKNVCSVVMNVLPFFADCHKETLNKVLCLSLFSILKENVYDFVGSSFYPNDEELEAITLDGQTLSSDEFVQIQSTLEEAIECGTIDDNSFNDALTSIAALRS